MISHPLSVLLLRLALQGAEFEECIQRAKTDDGGQHEHRSEHEQYDAQRAGDNPTKIQVGEQRGNNNTDNTIKSGKIGFHIEFSFCELN